MDLVHHPTLTLCFTPLHQMIETGNILTMHIPICRHSKTMNKPTKIKYKTLEVEFCCLMIKMRLDLTLPSSETGTDFH
jgi:hypothetical protein